MTRAIFCTVVEVPPMSDLLGSHAGGFEDLVPWADPYIASLIEKLRREHAGDEDVDSLEADCAAELPPPLESDNPRELPWQSDWTRRGWPGNH